MFAQGARVLETGGLYIYNPITDLSARDFSGRPSGGGDHSQFFSGGFEEHELVVSINGGYRRTALSLQGKDAGRR
jgi:hypothetical protein